MNIQSIEQIRSLRDSLRERIKNIDKSQNNDVNYGNEGEYNFRSLLLLLESLMTDLSTLTSAPNKFLRISSYDERSVIIQYLNHINNSFNNPYGYIAQLEALKLILRNFNVRNFSESQIDFENEIENIYEIKQKLEEELNSVIDIKSQIEYNSITISNNISISLEKLHYIEDELATIVQSKNKLIEQSDKLSDINSKLSEIKNEAEKDLNDIKQSSNESKSNEKLIISFVNRVQEREKRLGELELSTEENIKKLNEYDVERKSILTEAQGLIKSAKDALNYKTAEGISASFQEQYLSANNRWVFGSWIAGAIICLLATVSLGIWILHSATDDIILMIGRISLLPLPIIGTIFCANQYTRQKNIIEDYAYKMVLSKAIVGFSEQLKKHGSESNEEYIHYIKTALKEIHKDPLRKREKNSTKGVNSNLKDLVEVAEKIVKLSKPE